eukprot:GHUV01018811.1.p1 GENE.GHUV01018811.1~~GHUV01018811.1.p1  ORF type:complete len:106 (-),score=32.42 GHUV01018811.1:2409-2726(-)
MPGGGFMSGLSPMSLMTGQWPAELVAAGFLQSKHPGHKFSCQNDPPANTHVCPSLPAAAVATASTTSGYRAQHAVPPGYRRVAVIKSLQHSTLQCCRMLQAPPTH